MQAELWLSPVTGSKEEIFLCHSLSSNRFLEGRDLDEIPFDTPAADIFKFNRLQ